MHICQNELLLLSLLLNVFQTGGWVNSHHLVKEARRVARSLRKQLLERPVRTIVYRNGKGTSYND